MNSPSESETNTRPLQVILVLFLAALLLGAWELLVTRLASVLFFIGITHLALGISLLGFSIGAMAAGQLKHKISINQLAALTLFMMPAIWIALSYSNLAWALGIFALPFVSFGAASAMAWQAMDTSSARSRLYFSETVGTVCGLVLLGPLLLTQLPINSLGSVGFNNHLRELVNVEGLREHSQWSNAYATTDQVRTEREDTVYFFTDARFVTRSVAWDGSSDQFSSTHTETLAKMKRLAMASAASDDVLLLGAGAGFDIAVALQSGAQQIDAVEVNETTIEIANSLEAWAGGVMSHEKVNVHVAEARRFVSQAMGMRWDQINLTLLQTSPSTGRGASHVDGRVLTREAMQNYLDLLNPGGTISIIQNTRLLANRTTATALSVVNSDQLLRFELPAQENNPFNQLLLIRKEAFPAADVDRLSHLGADLGATRITDFNSDNVATDDRPFLFVSLFSSTIHILVACLGALALLSIVLVRHRQKEQAVRWALSATLVGTVAMAVQALIIYRMQGALGNPVLALSLSLGATLVGAGVGALLAQKLHFTWLQAGLAALIGGSVLTMAGEFVVHQALALPLAQAAVLTTGFVFCCALPFGLPFLAVMQEAKLTVSGNESLVLASDGAGGVFGAAMAVVVAMVFGFTILGVAVLVLLVIFTLMGRGRNGY